MVFSDAGSYVIRDRSHLHTLVLNSLEEQIAVIDQAGRIVDVNSAWIDFGVQNGIAAEFASVGSNYLEVLKTSGGSGDSLATEAAQGILDVLGGKRVSFYFEYPCDSPEQKRWFLMRVTRLKDSPDPLFVISHHNITERKLAEEQAEHLSRHDPLTGLANRRYFNEILGDEMGRSIRHQSAISLILLDVDHFKDYNDALGHPAGDQCLVKVGQVLLAFSHRPGDLAARLGGDEFALILGETDFIAVQKITAAISKAVADLDMPNGNGPTRVTLSIGAVSLIPHSHRAGKLLFETADKALYRAKLAGRNCVVHEHLDSNKQT